VRRCGKACTVEYRPTVFVSDLLTVKCPHARTLRLFFFLFIAAAPNVCGSSVWNLLQVTLLEPGMLRLVLGFWENGGRWYKNHGNIAFRLANTAVLL